MVMSEAELEAWRRSIREDTFFRYHYAMADALEREGSLDAAAGALERGLGIVPDRPEAVVRLRRLLSRTGQEQRAAAIHESVRSRIPRYESEGWLRAGDLAREEQRHEAAMEAYRTALSHDPSLAPALYGLVCALVESRRDRGVEDEVSRLLSQPLAFPDEERKHWAGEFLGLGIRQLAVGKVDLGAILFRQSQDLDYGDGVAGTQLGLTLLSRMDLAAAEKAFGSALRVGPDRAEAHLFLGLCHQAADRLEAAIAAMRRACALDESGLTAGALGCALHKAGRLDEALRHYGRALELWPKAASSHTYIALGQIAQGLLGPALASLERAVAFSPADSFALMNQALVLQRLGRKDEAESCLRETLRQPEWIPLQVSIHPFARADLAVAYRSLGFSWPASGP